MPRRYLRADFLKMKNLPVLWAHIWIPVAINTLFLSYYAFTGWSTSAKIIGFFESFGAGFPILIGIFAADVAKHEQNAGRFQNLLSQPRKTTAFLSKVILLLLLGLFSVVLTAVIFGAGFRVIANNCDIGMITYLTAALMMWFGSIPLYIVQMIIAFGFGKGASVGTGLFAGLLGALILTDLGRLVWEYVPPSWMGRMPVTYLRVVFGTPDAVNELKKAIPIVCVVTIMSLLCYRLWASRFEGDRITE